MFLSFSTNQKKTAEQQMTKSVKIVYFIMCWGVLKIVDASEQIVDASEQNPVRLCSTNVSKVEVRT